MQLYKENALIDAQQPEETTAGGAAAEVEPNTTGAEDADSGPELDIVINNVVCSFSVRCHLNLRMIALNGSNVEYRRENGMVTMRLRRPYTTASVWSSGRITCTGATSESQAKVAARRFARCLGKLGFPVHFQNFRIFNVLGTCSMPWSIRIVNFSEQHRQNASYEPELHPGVTYKMSDPKATLKIFSTGSITVTAANVNIIELAVQRIYPLVHEFRNENYRRDLMKAQQETSISRSLMSGYRTPNTTWRPKLPMMSTARVFDFMPTTSNFEPSPLTIPSFSPNPNVPNDASNSMSNSMTGGSVIFSNARRRATECWVNKLQNKRSRFNDAHAMTKINALARSVSNQRLPVKPSNVLLNQAKSQPLPETATGATDLSEFFTTNPELVEPTDCPVEDLIEELSHDDIDWQV